MHPRSLIVLAFFALAACSGGPSGKATFDAPSEGASPSPAVEAAGADTQGVALPANLPPASMFIGAGSHRTTPVRYCLDGTCAELKPAAPPSLEGPSEAPVLFTLSAAPLRAKLAVAGPGVPAGNEVGLQPGSSMSWQPQLQPGLYRLTLTASYEKTDVSWAFALKIVEGTRR